MEYDPNEWALVYLVTEHGGARGNLFILRVEDAVKLCEDPCSHGIGRGGHWIFMWTTLSHFIHKDDVYGDNKHALCKRPHFVFIPESGKQDADFVRLGIKKPSTEEMRRILEAIGYELEYKRQKGD